MDRNTTRGLVIVIIVLLAIIAIALAGIFGLLLFRQSNVGIRLGIDEPYPTVMTRNVDNSYENYRISLIAGEVSIQNSEDNQVHYTIQADEKKLTVNDKDGTLEIIDKSQNKARMKTKRTSHITVAVPADFSGTFTVESEAGNITLGKFPNASLVAKASAGEIKVGEIAAVKTDCNAGDIGIEQINGKAEITANAGNIHIGFADLKDNSKISCNFGNIEVDKLSDIRVTASCSLGQKSVAHSNDASPVVLEVNADCGNISIR